MLCKRFRIVFTTNCITVSATRVWILVRLLAILSQLNWEGGVAAWKRHSRYALKLVVRLKGSPSETIQVCVFNQTFKDFVDACVIDETLRTFLNVVNVNWSDQWVSFMSFAIYLIAKFFVIVVKRDCLNKDPLIVRWIGQ